jgi:hypothetical protein
MFIYLCVLSVALTTLVLVGAGPVSSSQKGTGEPPVGSVQVPASGDFFLLKNGKLIEIEEHPGYQKFLRGRAYWTKGASVDCMYIIDGPKASFRIPASKNNLVFISKIKIDPVGIQGGDLFSLATTKDGKMRYMVMTG